VDRERKTLAQTPSYDK